MINLDNFHTLFQICMQHSMYVWFCLAAVYYTVILGIHGYRYVMDSPKFGRDIGFELTGLPLVGTMAYLVVAIVISVIISALQWLALYIAVTLALLWLILFVARSVVRLNRKLDAHTKDKGAHK